MLRHVRDFLNIKFNYLESVLFLCRMEFEQYPRVEYLC